MSIPTYKHNFEKYHPINSLKTREGARNLDENQNSSLIIHTGENGGGLCSFNRKEMMIHVLSGKAILYDIAKSRHNFTKYMKS